MKTVVLITLLAMMPFNFFAQMPEAINIGSDIELFQLKTGIYRHTSYKVIEPYGKIGANGLVVLTDSGAVIINTPWDELLSLTLIDWLADSLKTKIAVVIVTHSHEDCAGGLSAFDKPGIKWYGLDVTQQILKKEQKAFPYEIFSDSLLISVGNKDIELFYPGAGHTVDNITVWLHQDKVLFGGCLIKAADNKSLGNITEADLMQWPASVKKVQKRYSDAEIIIPGHGNSGTKELLDHTIDLLINR